MLDIVRYTNQGHMLSVDLPRLGLLEGHFRLALGELGRTVLVLGGQLQYCGHLDPNGYTPFLTNEIKRYGRQGHLLSVVLAWSVHRRLRLSVIQHEDNDLGVLGSITCLDAVGIPLDCSANRGESPPGLAEEAVAPSLSAMRQFAVQKTQGRMLLGGRRSGYEGIMPGVLEEALLALIANQPLYLAGGFGGVTHDIVAQIDPLAAAWLPSNVHDGDDGWQAGLKRLSTVIDGRGWEALANGLSAAENVQLAATHRPSEIATFVSLGLGRLAQRGMFSTEANAQGT